MAAEHAGDAAHAGHHAVLRRGGHTDQAAVVHGRRGRPGGLLPGRPGHELLLLRAARSHLRHLLLSHRQRLQSAHHPRQPPHVGQPRQYVPWTLSLP